MTPSPHQQGGGISYSAESDITGTHHGEEGETSTKWFDFEITTVDYSEDQSSLVDISNDNWINLIRRVVKFLNSQRWEDHLHDASKEAIFQNYDTHDTPEGPKAMTKLEIRNFTKYLLFSLEVACFLIFTLMLVMIFLVIVKCYGEMQEKGKNKLKKHNHKANSPFVKKEKCNDSNCEEIPAKDQGVKPIATISNAPSRQNVIKSTTSSFNSICKCNKEMTSSDQLDNYGHKPDCENAPQNKRSLKQKILKDLFKSKEESKVHDEMMIFDSTKFYNNENGLCLNEIEFEAINEHTCVHVLPGSLHKSREQLMATCITGGAAVPRLALDNAEFDKRNRIIHQYYKKMMEKMNKRPTHKKENEKNSTSVVKGILSRKANATIAGHGRTEFMRSQGHGSHAHGLGGGLNHGLTDSTSGMNFAPSGFSTPDTPRATVAHLSQETPSRLGREKGFAFKGKARHSIDIPSFNRNRMLRTLSLRRHHGKNGKETRKERESRIGSVLGTTEAGVDQMNNDSDEPNLKDDILLEETESNWSNTTATTNPSRFSTMRRRKTQLSMSNSSFSESTKSIVSNIKNFKRSSKTINAIDSSTCSKSPCPKRQFSISTNAGRDSNVEILGQVASSAGMGVSGVGHDLTARGSTVYGRGLLKHKVGRESSAIKLKRLESAGEMMCED